MRIPPSLAVVSSFLLANVVLAQLPDNLIGITRNTPILDQRNHNGCAPLPFCTPFGFPAAVGVPYAGGTGWDPIRNGAVVSNGQVIAEIDPNTCAYICPPFPAPTVSPNALVTGLEVVESLNEIWMLDSFGALTRMTYGCPPVPFAVCNTGLPLTVTNATGGLAVDEKNGFVFYSYSNWTTGASTIHIAPMANPCLTVQVVVPLPCFGSVPLRGITGLAVDASRQILYMTDGFQSIGWSYLVTGAPLNFGPQTCCFLPPSSPGDQWIGLAVRTGRESSTGTACANGSCPSCPMLHTLRNSPNLGNAAFTLGLDGVPLSSFAICGIGVGPCLTASPTVPPFCGPILVQSPLIVTLGPVFTAAGAGCTGVANFGLGLPMNPIFAGLVLSSQCVAFCAGTGNSLSNCISFELQTN